MSGKFWRLAMSTMWTWTRPRRCGDLCWHKRKKSWRGRSRTAASWTSPPTSTRKSSPWVLWQIMNVQISHVSKAKCLRQAGKLSPLFGAAAERWQGLDREGASSYSPSSPRTIHHPCEGGYFCLGPRSGRTSRSCTSTTRSTCSTSSSTCSWLRSRFRPIGCPTRPCETGPCLLVNVGSLGRRCDMNNVVWHLAWWGCIEILATHAMKTSYVLWLNMDKLILKQWLWLVLGVWDALGVRERSDLFHLAQLLWRPLAASTTRCALTSSSCTTSTRRSTPIYMFWIPLVATTFSFGCLPGAPMWFLMLLRRHGHPGYILDQSCWTETVVLQGHFRTTSSWLALRLRPSQRRLIGKLAKLKATTEPSSLCLASDWQEAIGWRRAHEDAWRYMVGAMNDKVRTCGASPNQWLFGRNPRVPEDLLSPDGRLEALRGLDQDKQLRLRSYVRAQADAAALSLSLSLSLWVPDWWRAPQSGLATRETNRDLAMNLVNWWRFGAR